MRITGIQRGSLHNDSSSGYIRPTHAGLTFPGNPNLFDMTDALVVVVFYHLVREYAMWKGRAAEIAAECRGSGRFLTEAVGGKSTLTLDLDQFRQELTEGVTKHLLPTAGD